MTPLDWIYLYFAGMVYHLAGLLWYSWEKCQLSPLSVVVVVAWSLWWPVVTPPVLVRRIAGWWQ